MCVVDHVKKNDIQTASQEMSNIINLFMSGLQISQRAIWNLFYTSISTMPNPDPGKKKYKHTVRFYNFMIKCG